MPKTEEPVVGERFIILLRHAPAEPREEGKEDRERTLTDEGKKLMKRISKGLLEIFPYPDALFASPYIRCVETALRVSKAYEGEVTVRTSDALAPGASPADFSELVLATTHHRMILVGHEPNLTAGMLALTGITAPTMELDKGGCYGVRVYDDYARLEWMLTPKMLRRMG